MPSYSRRPISLARSVCIRPTPLPLRDRMQLTAVSADLAFIDRADLKQYVGLPNRRARYEILLSCLQELARLHMIDTAVCSSCTCASPLTLSLSL
jgi:hypothetical protein